MSACSREVGLQPADTDLNQKRCSSTLRQLTTNLDLAPNILVTAVMQNFTGAFCGLQNMSKCVSSLGSALDAAEELTMLSQTPYSAGIHHPTGEHESQQKLTTYDLTFIHSRYFLAFRL